jgi:hypothetical protein
MSWVEFTAHQSRFRLGYQAVQRYFMAQMGGKILSNGLARDELHGS